MNKKNSNQIIVDRALVYVNGKYIPTKYNLANIEEQYGLFESLIFTNGKIFKLKEHLDRLYDGAKVLQFNIPLNKTELSKAIYKTIEKNHLTQAYVRVSVFKSCQSINIHIIAKPLPQYPKEIYTQGVSIITVPTRRYPIESINPLVKSSNFGANILAKMEGIGHFEAIMLNENGYVTEGTISNIFICKKRVLITPPAYLGLLKGITRNFVIELAKTEQIEVKEEVISRFDLYSSSEAFLTFTSAGIVPITKIDGQIVGNGHPGIITQKLLSLLYQSFSYTP
jgi:branched-chain amino acid aminotransferase